MNKRIVNKMENKRRDFLKNACAPVVFSMFSISLLEACSSADDDDYQVNPPTGGGDNSGSEEEKKVTIDLSNSNEDMLLLRISDDEIRAFSNVCPHAGANNQWSYSGSKFNCGNHNRSFNDDCSGSGLKLTCYSTKIDGNTLTVTR